MASATRKDRKGKPAGRRAGKARTPARAVAAKAPADDQPERSAPSLAEVDAEVLEFIDALDRFKKQHGRPFPSWSEVLLVLRQLGYARR